MKDSILRTNLGGAHVSQNLRNLLQKRYPNLFLTLTNR